VIAHHRGEIFPLKNTNPQTPNHVKVIYEALKITQQRAILLSDWKQLYPETNPRNVYFISYCPHAWLFPRTKAVFVHGGAGSVAAGLRAGVPVILAPFGIDQPFWAFVLEKLGVSPSPIDPQKGFNVDNVVQAINVVIKHTELRVRAKELSIKFNSENGVEFAIQIMEETIKRHNPNHTWTWTNRLKPTWTGPPKTQQDFDWLQKNGYLPPQNT